MQIRTFPDRDAYCRLAESGNVVPVCTEVLADTLTPVALLQRFIEPEGATFLFESVEGGERWGRYSFLGTSARAHLRVYPRQVELDFQGRMERIDHGGDPLVVMRDIAARFRPAAVDGLPRFWGGFVGYLTYEMVNFFEAVGAPADPRRPLAHFIVPGEVIVFDNLRHTLTAVALTFPEPGAPAGEAFDRATERTAALLARASAPSGSDADAGTKGGGNGPVLVPAIDREDFLDQVRRTKDYIRQGEIIQAVVSQRFDCPQPPDLWQLYRAQRFVNPSPYLFFLQLDGQGLVGSSPETMVRLENGTATLRPIAGTRPRGDGEQADRQLADDLLADEKERAEHLMLVDLGRNDLGRVAETGTVQVTDLMVVERYSHVMHLVSNITAELQAGSDAWDLLRATFPAGTLSGAPKVRAMEIIAEMEQSPRGAYGGAVGYISFDGNMDLAITIRTACMQDGRLSVRAGAGIVADSDPQREWEETVNKARAIGKALEMVHAAAGRPAGEEASCS